MLPAVDSTIDAHRLARFHAAAKAIMKATHILVAAGAGFSADSGLPCYDAIASVPAYMEQNITYADLCTPSLLKGDPRLAYGFWGSCFNLYSETSPHDGYGIIKRWCCDAKSWHVYTSNVDGHFRKSGFPPDSVCEFHGQIDEWIPTDLKESEIEENGGQSGNPGMEACRSVTEKYVTQLSSRHRFEVEAQSQLLAEHDGEDNSGVPRDEATNCRLRPAVLMFGDTYEPLLQHLRFSTDRYQQWEASVEEELRTDPAAHFVVLELGCGSRVPAVRAETSWVLRDSLAKAAESAGCDATAPSDAGPRVLRIRINPEDDDSDPEEDAQVQASTLHICERALPALRRLDALIEELSSPDPAPEALQQTQEPLCTLLAAADIPPRALPARILAKLQVACGAPPPSPSVERARALSHVGSVT